MLPKLMFIIYDSCFLVLVDKDPTDLISKSVTMAVVV